MQTQDERSRSRGANKDAQDPGAESDQVHRMLNHAMNTLSRQRCYNHHQREAVVRCPDCGRYYCRECVTEHDERMMCSQCLQRLNDHQAKTPGTWGQKFLAVGQGVFGFLVLWYAFYLVGIALSAIPYTFHEGTIWQSGWWTGR